MNIRDCGEYWYIDLEKIRDKLNTFEDCEDPCEMIELARTLSADVDSVMSDIDSEFELNMTEEE
jgi:hypothetical protein